MDIVILDSAYKHNISIDNEVNNVVIAVEHGNFRQATKKESMEVRLAALSNIVHNMQETIKNDKELVNA